MQATTSHKIAEPNFVYGPGHDPGSVAFYRSKHLPSFFCLLVLDYMGNDMLPTKGTNGRDIESLTGRALCPAASRELCARKTTPLYPGWEYGAQLRPVRVGCDDKATC
jgi:hypothetical protein